MEVLKPKRLHPGDVIGLVAPASRPSADEKVGKGVQYLERLGYRVKVGRHVYDLHGYLAGRDEDRAGDFNEMIRDKNVKAIFTIRGGTEHRAFSGFSITGLLRKIRKSSPATAISRDCSLPCFEKSDWSHFRVR